jgi:hypothetical protein
MITYQTRVNDDDLEALAIDAADMSDDQLAYFMSRFKRAGMLAQVGVIINEMASRCVETFNQLYPKRWVIHTPDGDDRDPDKIKPNRLFVSEKQALKVAAILAEAHPNKRFCVFEATAVVMSKTTTATVCQSL